jgi:hypothetical protein
MTDYPKDLDGLRWEKDDGKRAGYLIHALSQLRQESSFPSAFPNSE